MKKLSVFFLCAALAAPALANDEEAAYSVNTNSFWSNWFISANATYTSTYSNQEQRGFHLDRNPLRSFRSAPGFSVSVGKWFSPGFGTRIKVDGIDGRQVNFSEEKHVIHQGRLELDALFNVTNMLFGYKRTRVYNLIPYLGVGGVRTFDHNAYGKMFSTGLLNTFRVNDRVLINFELGFDQARYESDGVSSEGNQPTLKNQRDRYFAAELGLTFNVGKTGWKKAVTREEIAAEYEPSIAMLNEQISDANGQIAQLKDDLAKKPKEIVRTEVDKIYVSTPYSTFFNKNSSQLSSKREEKNLEGIAEVAKANKDLKVYVTGYADSATGSPSYNQTLSEKRAEVIASKLEALGVSRSQMVVSGKGGVAELNPDAHNRRVILEIK